MAKKSFPDRLNYPDNPCQNLWDFFPGPGKYGVKSAVGFYQGNNDPVPHAIAQSTIAEFDQSMVMIIHNATTFLKRAPPVVDDQQNKSGGAEY